MNTVSCIIPIRSESKSIKNKNIKSLGDKPLVCYVIKEALKSNIFDKIIIATDSKNYIKEIKKIFHKNKYINYYLRLKKNSKDNSPTELVLKEVIDNFFEKNKLNNHLSFLVQATSPFTSFKDLKNSLKYFELNKFDSLFSSAKSKKFLWKKRKNIFYPINYNFEKRVMRQNFDVEYYETGAFYIFKTKSFLKKRNRLFGRIGTYLTSEINSLDINTKYDFEIAKLILSNKKKLKKFF